MTNLIKVTNTYRVNSVEDALRLRKELEKTNGGELTSFKYTQKYIKVKGEIVDSYVLVSASISFDDEKDPVSTIREHYGYLSELKEEF